MSLVGILSSRLTSFLQGLWCCLKSGVKMRCGAGPLAVVAAVFWTQCVLLDGVDAKKERKRPKEATPQHTETYNATLSNSEELDGSIKVVTKTF